MAIARVLIVDDETILLGITSRILRHAGYEALATTSPLQAIEIVKNQPSIDVIVSDVIMPEMSGTELVREVGRICPQITRLLMTGGIVNSTKAPDGVPILRKPFSAAQLISAVAAVLERSPKLCARAEASSASRDVLERSIKLYDELSREHQTSAELLQRNRRLLSECEGLVQEAVVALAESRRLATGRKIRNRRVRADS